MLQAATWICWICCAVFARGEVWTHTADANRSVGPRTLQACDPQDNSCAGCTVDEKDGCLLFHKRLNKARKSLNTVVRLAREAFCTYEDSECGGGGGGYYYDDEAHVKFIGWALRTALNDLKDIAYPRDVTREVDEEADDPLDVIRDEDEEAEQELEKAYKSVQKVVRLARRVIEDNDEDVRKVKKKTNRSCFLLCTNWNGTSYICTATTTVARWTRRRTTRRSRTVFEIDW